MAKNVIGFNKVLRSLLNNLSVKSSQGDSIIKLATVNMSSGSNNVMTYGLVQCTSDLNQNQCSDRRIGGRVLMPSYNFGYEIGSFYNETQKAAVTPSPQLVGSNPPANAHGPSSSQPSNGEGGQTGASIIILSAIIAAVVTAIFYY